MGSTAKSPENNLQKSGLYKLIVSMIHLSSNTRLRLLAVYASNLYSDGTQTWQAVGDLVLDDFWQAVEIPKNRWNLVPADFSWSSASQYSCSIFGFSLQYLSFLIFAARVARKRGSLFWVYIHERTHHIKMEFKDFKIRCVCACIFSKSDYLTSSLCHYFSSFIGISIFNLAFIIFAV